MKELIYRLASMSRWAKVGLLGVLDLLALPVMLWLSYAIRLFDPGVAVMPGLSFAPLWVSVLSVAALAVVGLYRFIVRSFDELFFFKLAMAVLIVIALLYLMAMSTSAFIPRSIPIMYGFLMFTWVWSSRSIIRLIIRQALQSGVSSKRIAIYGAGHAGQQIAAALALSNQYQAIFFIDDKNTLQGHMVGGLRVYSCDKALSLFDKLNINEVLLALPSVSKNRKKQIIQSLESAHRKITELPNLTAIMDGQIALADIREVDVVALLGRDPIPPIANLLHKNIRDKVVMVTGAGGSIGAELCRQIIQNKPKLLILFELSEYALYAIDKELRPQTVALHSILGSVLDQAKLQQIMQTYAVQTVYHAAAYKHVPLVEANPIAGIQNNSLGTARCLDAAMDSGVETFVLISTDKAVRPTNVMGASKRMAELYCQAKAQQQMLAAPSTQISIVRFGNVLGSSGSVVPLFKQQIAKGGPITVTHPEVTRYFMTIPEAAQLVIQAGAMGTGGDVFLLDMGEPVRIVDLAKQMVLLSGLSLKNSAKQGDIEIIYSGLRPGEKLYEELLIDHENCEGTAHPRILKAFEKHHAWLALQPVFNRFDALDSDPEHILWLLTQLEYFVDGYHRSAYFS